MSTTAAVLSSLGGIVAFITGIYLVIRAVFKNVNATESNTKALNELTATVKKQGEDISAVKLKTAILEDRIKRVTHD